MKASLRDYQQECQRLIKEKGPGKWLMVLATGLGKTFTFTSLPDTGRTLILAHTKDLVTQPKSYYNEPVGIEMGNLKSNGERVILASMQSLKNRLDRFPPDYFDQVIVDEAHHAVSSSYKRILDHFKPRQLLGFTATPNRADSVGLCSVFDEIIFERNIEWAIKQNYLSNLKCIRADLDWDLSKIATRLGDFSTKELNKIVNIQGANERISKIVAEKAVAPGIIFCVSIEHAKAIEELVPNSKVVIGETKDREEIFNRFKNGEINWLISVGVLTEGVDLPNAITAVVARPTKSAALYTQMVGRILRLYEGKEYGLVIDCVGNTQNHSLCSAPTLLGYEVNPAANFSPEDLEGDLFDLPDKIEKINDQPEVWLRNFKEVSLFRKDNKIDTRDLAFVVMPGGELILPYNRNEWIGIAKIDLAGMTEVIGSHGTKGGRKPAQVCIDLIFGWLLKKATNMNYCRESLIKRRPLLPPSTKQANYCRGLMRKYGYEFKKGMTARDAAVIISRLKSKEIYDRSRKTRRIP